MAYLQALPACIRGRSMYLLRLYAQFFPVQRVNNRCINKTTPGLFAFQRLLRSVILFLSPLSPTNILRLFFPTFDDDWLVPYLAANFLSFNRDSLWQSMRDAHRYLTCLQQLAALYLTVYLTLYLVLYLALHYLQRMYRRMNRKRKPCIRQKARTPACNATTKIMTIR